MSLLTIGQKECISIFIGGKNFDFNCKNFGLKIKKKERATKLILLLITSFYHLLEIPIFDIYFYS